jgi:ABC-type sugar transport system substrate-binding protein
LLLALLLVVAACSSEGTEGSTTTGAVDTTTEGTEPAGPTTTAAEATTTTAAETPQYVLDAQALVEEASAPPEFDNHHPSTPAPPFEEGVNLAVLNANSRSVGAQIQEGGVRQAAGAVGWLATAFDGAGTNEGRLRAFRTILSQDFDAIALVATDQRVVGDAMVEAADRGIPVVSTMAGNESGSSPEQVFAEAGMDDLREGRVVGSWIVADSWARGEDVKALLFFNPVNRTVQLRDQGVQEVLEACEHCEIVAAEEYTSLEVFQIVPQRIQAVLAANPDINYVMIDVGAYAIYAIQGIQQLGGDFADQISLISFDCVPAEVSAIINGEIQTACEGAASEFSGYIAVDELNRALHGEAPGGSRVPTQLITIDNYAGVTTPSTGYTGPFDYRSLWRAYWTPPS